MNAPPPPPPRLLAAIASHNREPPYEDMLSDRVTFSTFDFYFL